MNLLRSDGPLLRIGHRGAAALAPANTIEAVEAALAVGVDAVEVDIFWRDSLVIGHSRRELGIEPVSADAMFGFLAERAPEVGVLTDLKLAERERELVEVLRRHGLVERTVACTSDAGVLRRLRELEPSLARSRTNPRGRVYIGGRRTHVPVAGPMVWMLRQTLPLRIPALVREVDASAMTLSRRVVTRAAVERCHELGVAVLVWTVNNRALATRLNQLGVDGIITDDPHILGD